MPSTVRLPTRILPVLFAALVWPAASAQPPVALADAPPEADRRAILAMQGEYAVDFAFEETALLQPGYTRAPAQHSRGSEWVTVVEDRPGRIVLQHLLLDPRSGRVTKHWRQDWTWEAASRFEYVGDETWRVRALPAAVTAGAWTQCVYEVDDAPRYCGTGRWAHADGVSTWTSDPVWRPLPRREYTKRHDYDVLESVHRHTIVPGGWTHEQFSTKLAPGAEGARHPLVREVGFNDYRRVQGVDFAPARAYWKATAGYWAQVRARWARGLAQPPGVHVKAGVDGMPLIEALFAQAAQAQAGNPPTPAAIDAVFAQWVEPASPASPPAR
jgi:hypothetical protein